MQFRSIWLSEWPPQWPNIRMAMLLLLDSLLPMGSGSCQTQTEAICSVYGSLSKHQVERIYDMMCNRHAAMHNRSFLLCPSPCHCLRMVCHLSKQNIPSLLQSILVTEDHPRIKDNTALILAMLRLNRFAPSFKNPEINGDAASGPALQF